MQGDDYVIVRGGLVTNDPALPVYDLDVLDSDFIRDDTIEEVLELCERLHSAATDDTLLACVAECEEWLDKHRPDWRDEP